MGEENRRDYLPKVLSFFQTLNLWLEEPRLHDASLYLPGLPVQYNSERLSTVFSPNQPQLWMEFVPLWEVKGQQMLMVEEWLQVESYQKTLPSQSSSPSSSTDSASARIQKRLKRRNDPEAPPPLQPGPAPFEHLTEDILLSQDSLLVFLRSDIEFVVEQARSFCSKHTTLATLDTQYMDGVPELYSNEPRQFHVPVPCHSRFNRSHRCAQPATVVFKFNEMRINPKWEQQLAVNRSEYDELLSSLCLPLSHDLCKAVMRMEHTVTELSRLSEQLPDQSKSLAVRSGVSLFYEILRSINIDCRQFPPSCQFLTSCIQILGQEFIQRDPSQTLHILEHLLLHPSKADLLAPLFHPNNCPEQFLQMYSHLEMVATKEGPNVAFSVLTKFNVSQWLADYSPSFSNRSQLLDYVWRGLVLCGPNPALEFEILLEAYRHHLQQLVEYQFPELAHDVLQLIMEATDNATVIPACWTDLAKLFTLNKEHPEQCKLGLQLCQEIARLLSRHYLTRHSISHQTLYALVSWDYVPLLGNFLNLLCHTLIAKWEESVTMGTTTHQTAIVECWRCIVDVFAPWINSLQVGQDTSEPTRLPPCEEKECGVMGTVMAGFVGCVCTAHNQLKDPTQQTTIMTLLWQFYCSTLALPPAPPPVMDVYHAHLVNLPWADYYPDLAAIEAMMKFKLMDYYSKSSFVFLGNVFPKINWKAIVAAYCDTSLHGNTEAPIQLHVMLLQLLIMLAAETDVMNMQDTLIPEAMAEAQDFHWHYLDAKTYRDILDWQKDHCNPSMVLHTGSCLSLSLRLLKAAAGFPSSEGAREHVHPETWEKRQSYIRAVVHLTAQASQRKENHTANYSDTLSHLFQTAVDVCIQEPQEQGTTHITQMMQDILNLFNLCSPVTALRKRLLEIVIHILDQMSDVHFLSLPVTSAGCRSLVDISVLVKIVEQSLHTHFKVLPKPALESLELSQDPLGYGWQGVTSFLTLPQTKMEELCQICIAECAGLILHAHLLQALPQCSTLQQEFRNAVKVVQWCTQMKPKPSQEAKVFLLWEKAISLLLRQVRFGGLYLEVVPHFTALATCLTRFGEDKASEGILGVIGLGKKSSYSYKFRLISRAIATFLYCQMPVDSNQKTELRVVPNAPGHVKDPSRLQQQKTGGIGSAITPIKLGDSSLHGLESLVHNKHYSHLKDKISWCVSFVCDMNNCVMNTDRFLVELCTTLYPDCRFLDVLRVLQHT